MESFVEGAQKTENMGLDRPRTRTDVESSSLFERVRVMCVNMYERVLLFPTITSA